MTYEEFLNDSLICEGKLRLIKEGAEVDVRVQEMKVEYSYQERSPIHFYKVMTVGESINSSFVAVANQTVNCSIFPPLATITRNDGEEIPCYINSINFSHDMMEYTTMADNFPILIPAKMICEIGITVNYGCFSGYRNHSYNPPEIFTPFDRFEIMDFD